MIIYEHYYRCLYRANSVHLSVHASMDEPMQTYALKKKIKRIRAVPMQTPLIESKPQRLHHKKLYFPMQSVLLWFIWPTCLSHIYS